MDMRRLIIFFIIMFSLVYGQSISILIGGSADGWKEIADEFYKQYGIKVNVIQGPPSTDAREIMYSISLLTKTKGFDVIYLDVVWLGKFASAGWLTPISYFVDPEQYFRLNNLTNIEASIYKGEFFTIPIKADAGLLYYRKDLLEKYGYKPPTSWEELKQMAKDIKFKEKEKGINIEGFVFQGKQYEGLVCNFYEVLRGMGYELIIQEDQNFKIAVTEEELSKVYQYFRSLVEEGISPISVINFEEEESRIVFQQGKAVFARNWPYAIKMLMDDENMKDKFGVTILPGENPTLGGWALAISAYSPNKKEAWKFIDFTVKRGLKTLFLKRGDVPTKMDLFEDEDIKSRLPYYSVIEKSIDFSKPRTIHPLYPRISNIIQINLSGVISGKIDSKLAARKTIKELEKIINFSF
ncbi:MAG: ABC transporter substrate-binding protein [bacterium]